jgi:cytochrome c oxidase subunit 2
MTGKRIVGAMLALGPSIACASRYNLQDPNSVLGQAIYDLHNMILWVCLLIFVGVFAVMFYAVFKHRKSTGHKAAHFHENTLVEVVWTVIPFLVLIGIAVPATRTLVQQRDTSAADLTIKVTGYQWKWSYDYLKGDGEGISFVSTLSTPREQIEGTAPKGEHYLLEVDEPMVVPVGKKVRIVLTAADVLHAWWVPALAVKQDAIPGFVRDTWFRAEREGTFRGQCAELCGKDHAFMPIVVNVLSEENYAKWVEERKKLMAASADDPNKDWSLDELKARGEKVFAQNCVACHQGTGMGVPGTFPALNGSKLVMGPPEASIATVLHGVIRDGKPTAMQSFKQLSDVEIAAVVTYVRNAWDNKAGDAVKPADIKAAREKKSASLESASTVKVAQAAADVVAR